METLLTILVLVLLSALSGWLKKRTEKGEAEAWPPPAPPRPGQRRPPTSAPPASGSPAPTRPVTRSWEEELRRLLEGENPESVPPPLPGPQPLPPVIGAPPVGEPSRSLPTLMPPPPRPVVVIPSPAEVGERSGEVRETAVARLQVQRTRQEAEKMLEHVRATTAQKPRQRRYVIRAQFSPEIAAAREWLRHPRSARQAVIVSVVLDRPVGF